MATLGIVRRILTALAIVATVMALVAAPALDGAEARTQAVTMADGMPCCPEAPMAPDCAKLCAVVTVCVAASAAHFASAAAVVAPCPSDAMLLVGTSDAAWHSRIARPPPRPPKS